jgi:hypothetical protein
VRRFEEHRLPELLMAAGARDLDVSHAAAAAGSLPGRLAEARRPAHLRLAGPQLVTERTGFKLVLEQRNGHLNDHALTSCHASTIIVTCTDDRCRKLADVLDLEFEPAPYVLSSVLTCCDMTTSPDGELVPTDRRLAEIHHRHGPGHLVSRSIQRATPMILGAVDQVHGRTAPDRAAPQTQGQCLLSFEASAGQP